MFTNLQWIIILIICVIAYILAPSDKGKTDYHNYDCYDKSVYKCGNYKKKCKCGRVIKWKRDYIHKCKLYDGEPYIAEKDGKYHVLQGCFKSADVQKWYNTEKEAIYHWNNRVKSMGD